MPENPYQPPKDIVPPGASPLDHRSGDMDSVAWSLERVCTYLFWIAEHHTSFIASRTSDPENAERELGHLDDAITHGMMHAKRLKQLLLAGYAIDPNKRLPSDLTRLLERGPDLPAARTGETMDATNPQAEKAAGRVALWLSPADLAFLAQHCSCPPTASESDKDRCARIRFRANAALHKSGAKDQDQLP